MQRTWKRLKSPAGLMLAALILPVLAILGWLAWTHPADLYLLALALPGLGLLTADRETPQKEYRDKAYPMFVGTIFKGGGVCIDPNTGWARPAADTAGYRTVGIAKETRTNAGAAGSVTILVTTGVFRMAAASITQVMVGGPLYWVDDDHVDDITGVAQGVFAGILLEFLSATDCWILVGPGALPLVGVTASAAELNKCDGIPAAAFQVVQQEVTFVENGAGTYTGTIALPAGSEILDVAVHGIAQWTAAVSASMVVGDGGSPNGFFTATDVKGADLLPGEVNNIQHPGGLAGAYIAAEQRVLYSAAARNVIGVITSVGAGVAGRTRLVVTYCNPTAVAAVQT